MRPEARRPGRYAVPSAGQHAERAAPKSCPPGVVTSVRHRALNQLSVRWGWLSQGLRSRCRCPSVATFSPWWKDPMRRVGKLSLRRYGWAVYLFATGLLALAYLFLKGTP